MNSLLPEQHGGGGDVKNPTVDETRGGVHWLLWLGLVVLAFLLIAMYHAVTYDPITPRFEKLTRYQIPAYNSLVYNFLDDRPFSGGTVWLGMFQGTNNLGFILLDLDKREVAGRLLNAHPAHFNADHSRLLCMTRGPVKLSRTERAKFWAAEMLLRAHIQPPKWLKLPARSQARDEENFWVLDMPSGRATYVGKMGQLSGAGSAFHSSPDFRYAYNKPTALFSTNLAYLLDIEKQRLEEIHVNGWPSGWWDNRTLLTWTSNDLCLVDVSTMKSSLLIPASSITNFLHDHGIDLDSGKPSSFQAWNGQEFETYLTDTHKKRSADESFLLKVEHPDGKLALVSKNFKFEWSDHFDQSQRYYVYTGREPGDRTDGVYLRDLRTGTTNTLVASTGARIFSIPNFYGDRVIYLRSNALWSVNLDGKGNVRLFPP